MPTATANDRASGPGAWDPERMIDLLIQGGRLALEYRARLEREYKSDDTVVTAADRDIEAFLSRALERPAAGVHVIGEETVAGKGAPYLTRALEEVAYVVDPIDGTAPYSHDLPYWGISIGRLEGGRLTDGAVFLPELRGGEIVLSAGESVRLGRRDAVTGAWTWSELAAPAPEPPDKGLIAVSQELARRGRTTLPNPIQALGTAVFALQGVLLGRFMAYVGSLRLWDVAGCLPLLARLGFSTTHLRPGAAESVGLVVDSTHYELELERATSWLLRDGLVAGRADLDQRLRTGFG